MTGLTLHTADGVRLAARWWQPPVPPATGEAVVVVHGFCGGKDQPDVESIATHLAGGGRRVLTFDLRGHGGSEGATTLGLDERLDVDAAVRTARADADLVVVVGASMGGIASIAHLSDGLVAAAAVDGDGHCGRDDVPAAPAAGGDGARADGAVVVGTPALWRVPRSPRGVMAVALTQTRVGRAVTARRLGTRVAVSRGRGASPVERIAAVTCPVAVVHGLADRFVSATAARLLFEAAPEPRRLDLVPGMGHGFTAGAEEPVSAAVGWVAGEVARRRGAPRGPA
ncbi:MAG TPA: alpha/beta fold hydrolase [Acidimicrobiales bacterium]